MLRIRNLDAGYGKLRVLKNVSLHVDPGEIVTMIGANGAGKTTLLHTIIGLLRPMHGEISFQGQPCTRTPGGRLVAAGCA
ncbi:MAG: ATP-binding cassette domain-containing protein, partial [Desulfobulbaceae bacterium]|nr:ATP-binding cassette domain-containing protein [Desulfobulbaceae bacterium]